MAKVTKIGRICVESLNELADQAYAGVTLLSRRPWSPTFWFYGLAIDGKAHSFGPQLQALLSDQSKALLDLVDVGDFETADDYCTCVDESLTLVPLLESRPDLRTRREPCWPCLFGAHDRCSHECTSAGEIHFPEAILDPRVPRTAVTTPGGLRLRTAA